MNSHHEARDYETREGFVGAKFGMAKHSVILEEVRNGKGKHSTTWRNMRPICPYGCGQEGNLLEVMVKGDKAIGIYTHVPDVKPFTADLQMAPKPTGRKIVIGADGEPQLVEEV